MTNGHPSTQLDLGADVAGVRELDANGSVWTRRPDGRVVETRPAEVSVHKTAPAGQSELEVVCPFCEARVVGRTRSLHGSGKRCPDCDATLGHNAGWRYHAKGTLLPGETALPAWPQAPAPRAQEIPVHMIAFEDRLWEHARGMGAGGEYAYRQGVRDTIAAIRRLLP